MSLLVIGTVAFDSIESPYGKADRVVGGSGTYISWAASYFYKPIFLQSIVGEDFPVEEITALQNRGVKTQGLDIIKGKKSFYWSGKYHDNMNARDTLVTELNVLADFNPILPEAYKNSEFVMLGNLTPEVQISVLNQMNERPKLIVLDTMNFWMDIAMDQLLQVISMVDVLTLNEEEARQLSGEFSLVKAAEIIHRMGPKTLIIKKGEHGALLFSEGHIFFAPALPLSQVFDPTGAGDTFAGGFIGHLAKTRDLSFENMKRAIIFGSAMASFCVEEFSIDKMKTLSQGLINDRVRDFVELVRFDTDLSE
ncbi:MAG: bifunctional hydroxymethylpyrimidine kinase/phosphomethylpyrimidine kinase [Saprospiraceae bacterium]|jgi:sugar/nucleoside kinase (ribokinase family)|nr:bifunctional hydroxymethylpyrimidine kinase/phosphomethylpyrimidine kinase [Saprospiraceae bacterium]MBK7371706.1 bifunctional hydroxymethylpyrimidine kinase/phosphomethylpyrimidine kinase [Saprospiraceae bacterium]MBK7435817.1 bifunctional hydroxymethylpyrimidine kinase/phosphomethylpyrimidine kinase [Saprospiraceae bacterium]MBK7606466.1 bifunctional hydroxymethylpyrimidine kinase/phosphomethylpyrimidine kinase [Saprospiraceae bacterium]MBK8513952.1 bifunctional hydroxymethylpyrimidine kin